MQRRVFLALGIVCCLAAVAQASPTITVTSHTYTLAQVASGPQTIDVLASGGDNVTGLDLNLIFDGGSTGGPEPGSNASALPQGNTGAAFWTLVDATTAPAIFNPNNSGQTSDNSYDPLIFQVVLAEAALNSPAVAALGLLAELKLDFGGWGPGVYILSAAGNGVSAGGNVLPSDFGAPSSQETLFVDGTITIVPEPASVVLGLFAVAGLGAVVIRRRRMA
jgi:hypothetical protein